jgi:hypothetical protein
MCGRSREDVLREFIFDLPAVNPSVILSGLKLEGFHCACRSQASGSEFPIAVYNFY